MDVGLKKGIHQLWKQESLVDFTLVVNKQEFHLHKVVLASVSPHLEVTTCGSQTDRMELDGLTPNAVANFIELIYTGNWDIYSNNTQDIHNCAQYFQVQECSREKINTGLMHGVRNLRTQGLLLDYTIVVEEREFKVHKVVLASVSPYFQAMIFGTLNETETDRVELKGLSADAVSKLLELVYTGSWDIIAHNTAEILECAVYFQIPDVIRECRSILIRRLNTANCMTLLSTFLLYSFDEEVRKVKEFVRSEKRGVMENVRPADVSYEGLELVIEYWETAEWDLFQFIKNWIDLDVENRKLHINTLMSEVRFCLLEPGQIAVVKNTQMFKDYAGSWCELVEKAQVYHNLPVHLKVVENTTQNMARGTGTPVLINNEQQGARLKKNAPMRNTPSGDSSSNKTQTAVETVMYTLGGEWVSSVIPAAPELGQSRPVAIVVNNFLVLCTGRHTQQQWHLFDPSIKTWSDMPSMLTPKIHFALVHDAGRLYALGGNIMESFSRVESTTAGVEVFDFRTNAWSAFGSMPVAVADHAACVLDGCIYISGGRKNQGDYSGTKNLHCLNLKTDKWMKKPPMSKKMKNHSMHVMTKYGSQVIIVVDNKFSLSYYHPGRNQWSVLKPRFMPAVTHQYEWCPDTLVLSDHNNLYLLNAQGSTLSDLGRRRMEEAEDRAKCGCRNCVEWDRDDEDEDNSRLWCVYRGKMHQLGCDCEDCRGVRDKPGKFETRLCRRWEFPDYGDYVRETRLTLPLPGDRRDSAEDFCGALLSVPRGADQPTTHNTAPTAAKLLYSGAARIPLPAKW